MIEGREYLQALPLAIYITDAKGRLVFYNEAAAKFWGRCPDLYQEQWSGALRLYTLDGRLLDYEETPVAQTLRTGSPASMELFTERPDGTWVRSIAYPNLLRDKDGRITGVINLLADTTEREHKEAALARIAAIVSSSDDAILTKTLTGHITSWNRGATRIFGYEEEEMIGESINRIIPPELQDEETRILARIARGEHVDHFETVRIAKDGRRVNISLMVSPLYDKTGKVIGASKVARDVTERKKAEKLQQLLVGELNHRVKNTLAIVQSLASQTLRHASSMEDFSRGFMGRVQALARAHNLFTRDAWKGSDITDLVRDQLLVDGDDGRISYEGPHAALDPQAATSFSLVIHELGTNARKYGSLSVPDGRLNVRWEIQPNGSPQLVLHWIERGGPIVHSPLRRGFGSVMIEQSLKGYGGKVSLEYEPEGLNCTISLPLRENMNPLSQLMIALSPSSAHPSSNGASLKGKRILVIEDEPLLSLDIENCLTESGSHVVGPAGTLQAARQLIETAEIDCALVDANLGGEPVDDIAEALAARNIPFMFLTGYGSESLPRAFSHKEILTKPYTPEQLIAATDQMLQRTTVS